jgi:hypothetical protein
LFGLLNPASKHMQPTFVGGHQMVMSPTESMVEKIDSWIFLALQPTRENPAISSSESAILQPQRKQKLWVQTTSHFLVNDVWLVFLLVTIQNILDCNKKKSS